MAAMYFLYVLLGARVGLALSQGLVFLETLPTDDSGSDLEYTFYQQNQTTGVMAASQRHGRWLTVSNGKFMVHTVYAPGDDVVIEKCRVNRNPKEAVAFEREIRNRIAGVGSAASAVDPEEGVDETFRFERNLVHCERFLRNATTKSRSKRSYMIFPGTNWCGKGNAAEYANHLGLNSQVDVCCRTHDHCPFAIEGLSSRFNTFNYRLHTLSHCECDEQFKNCLKQANTNSASMVGKVYFNVVNTQCFDLKMEKVCSKRTWWGTCEKYATQWVANVRSLGYF